MSFELEKVQEKVPGYSRVVEKKLPKEKKKFLRWVCGSGFGIVPGYTTLLVRVGPTYNSVP